MSVGIVLLNLKVHQANGKGRKKPTRKRMVLEVYNDLYYQLKLRNMVQEALEKDTSYASLPQNERSARQMAIYRKIRADSWAVESDDVKAEVLKIYNQEPDKANSSNDNENDENDNDEKKLLQCQQGCVDVIGQVITSFLQDVNEATGWAFYVIRGGMNKEGEIKVATSSVGKTVSGSTFQITHKNWQEGIVGPWLDFLQLRHPIEERHWHATIWAEDSNAQDGSTLANTSSKNCIPIAQLPLQTAIASVTNVTALSPLQPAALSSSPSAPTVNVTAVSENDQAQNFNVYSSTDLYTPSLNVFNLTSPAFAFPMTPQTQVAPFTTMPEQSRLMSTTNPLYPWNFDGVNVGEVHLLPPSLNSYDSSNTYYNWTIPATSTFPSTAGAPGQATTPFAMTNLIASANGIAVLNNLGQMASLINTENGVATHLVLDTAANSMLDEVGNSVKENAEHGGNRLRKHKTHEEESTHFILPDGSHRPHKPRRIDENNAASTIKKGKGGKIGRRK